MIRIKQDPANKKTLISIDNLTRDHKQAIRNAGFDIGKESVELTRKNIDSKNKTGKIYRIGGRIHRASAPGEAPANLSGNLKRSTDYNVRGHTETEFGYKEDYGKFPEDGTRNMKRRPNIQPVGASLSQKFINYMVQHFRKSKR